jgi:hypothetical protein
MPVESWWARFACGAWQVVLVLLLLVVLQRVEPEASRIGSSPSMKNKLGGALICLILPDLAAMVVDGGRDAEI